MSTSKRTQLIQPKDEEGEGLKQQGYKKQPEKKDQSYLKGYGPLIATLAILVISGGIYYSSQYDPIYNDPASFEFTVFCPIYYDTDRFSQIARDECSKKSQEDLRLRRLQEQVNLITEYKRTYVISTQYHELKGQKRFMYCGLARNWTDSNCCNAKRICSSPGSIFEVNKGQRTNVVWVNNFNKSSEQIVDAKLNVDCYQSQRPDHCLNFAFKTDIGQTFDGPTDMPHSNTDVLNFSYTSNLPTSAHLHGAEIRPTFDGNPMSWHTSSGNYGAGAFTATDKQYYNKFSNFKTTVGDLSWMETHIEEIKNQKTRNLTKVNVYPNNQNPGNLWYHDHSMRVTSPNVKNGLSGMYIIRKQSLEDILPQKDYEKFIMMSWTPSLKSIQEKASHGDSQQSSQKLYKSSDDTFNKGYSYRFRILNNNVAQQTFVSFHKKSNKNCDPQTIIPVRIIGSDSSLMDKTFIQKEPLYISSSQRLEILVRFSEDSIICKKNQVIFKINVNTSESIDCSVQKPQKRNCSYEILQNMNLNVSFTNLTNLTDQENKEIAVKRMRPLIQRNGQLTVNGHYNFHEGQSQNPTIGTTQDWFLIHCMQDRVFHPIHVHLINFQVTQRYSLKTIMIIDEAETNVTKKNKYCALYELDFFFEAFKGSKLEKYFDKNSYDGYKKLCRFLSELPIQVKEGEFKECSQIISTNQTVNCTYSQLQPYFQKMLYKVNVQNVVDTKTNVSGIDVTEKRNTSLFNEQFTKKLLCGRDQTVIKTMTRKQKYNYRCDDDLSIYPYYRTWKDVATVLQYQTLVFRIRWAKPDYNGSGNYFNVPEDHIMEFPGYIYHCHILPHEDNEMMRSIMMQPSDRYKQIANGTCKFANWIDQVCCINNGTNCQDSKLKK